MEHGGDAYLFSQSWERERSRLTALEAIYDPISVGRLAALGVGPGWRCLEVGAGAGSVACWLAEAVGESGSVLATDMDVRFLEDARARGVQVARHDVRTDPLEAGAFDLVHARAVMEHLAEREEVVQRLVAALRPGGVLLLEDALFGGTASAALEPLVEPPEMGPLVTKLHDAVAAGYRAIGADPLFGARLPQRLSAAGLAAVDAAVCTPLLRGCGPGGAFYGLALEQVGPRLVEAGLLSADEFERAARFFQDPDARWMSLPQVSAWGRRPAD
jgi:SAM-dependent methyltransferase